MKNTSKKLTKPQVSKPQSIPVRKPQIQPIRRSVPPDPNIEKRKE